MNWERVRLRLGDVCKIDNGYAFKSKNYVSDKGARIIRITNVQKGKVVDNDPKLYPFEMLAGLERYEIFENDIMMSLTGNVGRVGRFPKEMLPAYINQRVCRIKSIDKKLDETYLFHFLNSDIFEREAIYVSAGIAQLNLSTNWVADYIIPLPPMSVQKEIVEKLDKAAAIREKSKALLAHYDALAESLFIELFGDPISNEKGWEKKKLGEVIMLNPKKAEISDIDKTKKGSFLEMANVLEDGSIILCDDRRIDEMWKGYTYFAENDVLFAKITPCMENGKGAVVKGLTNGIGFGSTEFHVLRPKAGISDSYWIYGIIKNNKFRNKAKQNMKGSAGQKRVPTEFLNGFEIPLPPLSLQIKFAEMVENIEKQKARAKAEIEQSEAVFQALLQESFG